MSWSNCVWDSLPKGSIPNMGSQMMSFLVPCPSLKSRCSTDFPEVSLIVISDSHQQSSDFLQSGFQKQSRNPIVELTSIGSDPILQQYNYINIYPLIYAIDIINMGYSQVQLIPESFCNCNHRMDPSVLDTKMVQMQRWSAQTWRPGDGRAPDWIFKGKWAPGLPIIFLVYIYIYT